MSDPSIRSQVLRRMGASDYAATPAKPPCRIEGCEKEALGLDGCCIPHSRNAERTGNWHTPELDLDTCSTCGSTDTRFEMVDNEVQGYDFMNPERCPDPFHSRMPWDE